jgi:hypothetical protein
MSCGGGGRGRSSGAEGVSRRRAHACAGAGELTRGSRRGARGGLDGGARRPAGGSSGTRELGPRAMPARRERPCHANAARTCCDAPASLPGPAAAYCCCSPGALAPGGGGGGGGGGAPPGPSKPARATRRVRLLLVVLGACSGGRRAPPAGLHEPCDAMRSRCMLWPARPCRGCVTGLVLGVEASIGSGGWGREGVCRDGAARAQL